MFDADIGCDDCHGTGREIKRPEPSVCVDCHDDDYEEMPAEWKSDVAALAAEVRGLIRDAPDDIRSRPEFRQAQQLLKDLRAGAANGMHNYDLALDLLSEFRNALRRPVAEPSP
jgi:hypothetical protein